MVFGVSVARVVVVLTAGVVVLSPMATASQWTMPDGFDTSVLEKGKVASKEDAPDVLSLHAPGTEVRPWAWY